eukprot:11278-Pelagococcus_subviridis.AAC.2
MHVQESLRAVDPEGYKLRKAERGRAEQYVADDHLRRDPAWTDDDDVAPRARITRAVGGGDAGGGRATTSPGLRASGGASGEASRDDDDDDARVLYCTRDALARSREHGLHALRGDGLFLPARELDDTRACFFLNLHHRGLPPVVVVERPHAVADVAQRHRQSLPALPLHDRARRVAPHDDALVPVVFKTRPAPRSLSSAGLRGGDRVISLLPLLPGRRRRGAGVFFFFFSFFFYIIPARDDTRDDLRDDGVQPPRIRRRRRRADVFPSQRAHHLPHVHVALPLRLPRLPERELAVHLPRLLPARDNRPRGAPQHLLLEDRKRALDAERVPVVADGASQTLRQQRRVRDGLVRALRLERRHRVRGVADDRHAASHRALVARRSKRDRIQHVAVVHGIP